MAPQWAPRPEFRSSLPYRFSDRLDAPIHMNGPVKETTGRFERLPTARSAAMANAFGGRGALTVMNHPQHENVETPRPALFYVHRPLHEASEGDVPAGQTKKATERKGNDSDPTILHHREYVPKPRRPPALAMHQYAVKQYLRELSSVTQQGLVGTAACSAAAKVTYGTAAAGAPPTPPPPSASRLQHKGMLVGKPRLAERPPAEWTPRTPRYTPPVPSHIVDGAASARQRALRRSQSCDFVRANKLGAGNRPPRTPGSARAERVAAAMSSASSSSVPGTPRQSAWKLRRFEQVEPRVFRPAGMATPRDA